MADKVNLQEALSSFNGHWEPRIVAMLNDYKVLVVKIQDEFVWHKHDDTDDFFLVVQGRMTIQLRERNVELEQGELFVVPRGVEHCPRADAAVHFLIVGPEVTSNAAGGKPAWSYGAGSPRADEG
jgi:mannose-6-phosphate isomerase-like protein (cupin superfamily)